MVLSTADCLCLLAFGIADFRESSRMLLIPSNEA